MKRMFAPMAVLCLGFALGSCGSFSGYVADHWPHWAGGMPDDVPPRPGAPGYEEFIAHGQASKEATASPAATEKANAQAAPSGDRPPRDQDMVQGGLY
ncbi:MAG TPA: hypothetical protein VK430_04340 [Xanthobacteraceae bacterium]|nr:hypothetical protein [Xanthobacteraceae bacterium]